MVSTDKMLPRHFERGKDAGNDVKAAGVRLVYRTEISGDTAFRPGEMDCETGFSSKWASSRGPIKAELHLAAGALVRCALEASRNKLTKPLQH